MHSVQERIKTISNQKMLRYDCQWLQNSGFQHRISVLKVNWNLRNKVILFKNVRQGFKKIHFLIRLISKVICRILVDSDVDKQKKIKRSCTLSWMPYQKFNLKFALKCSLCVCLFDRPMVPKNFWQVLSLSVSTSQKGMWFNASPPCKITIQFIVWMWNFLLSLWLCRHLFIYLTRIEYSLPRPFKFFEVNFWVISSCCLVYKKW